MNLFKTHAPAIIAISALALALAGCSSSPQQIHADSDTAGTSAGLDYRDCQAVAKAMLQDLFRSQRLVRPDGTRYSITVGAILNDTKIRDFRSDQIMWTIEQELENSGQVAVNSAVSSDKNNVNTDIYAVRELRGDAEFNQASIAQQGSLQAPTLGISGKIFESPQQIGGKVRIEYWIQLKITDLKGGHDIWRKQEIILKQGSKGQMKLR